MKTTTVTVDYQEAIVFGGVEEMELTTAQIKAIQDNPIARMEFLAELSSNCIEAPLGVDWSTCTITYTNRLGNKKQITLE